MRSWGMHAVVSAACDGVDGGGGGRDGPGSVQFMPCPPLYLSIYREKIRSDRGMHSRAQNGVDVHVSVPACSRKVPAVPTSHL